MSRSRTSSDTTEHRYAEERLSAYLDGELLPQERMAVDRHLAICQACRWNLETLRQTVQWTRELPDIPVPRAFRVPVPAQPVRRPRQRWGFVPLLQGATALLALLLAFAVAGDLLLSGAGFRATAPQQQEAREEATIVALVTQEDSVAETVAVEATQVVAAIRQAEPTPSPQAENVGAYAATGPAALPEPAQPTVSASLPGPQQDLQPPAATAAGGGQEAGIVEAPATDTGATATAEGTFAPDVPAMAKAFAAQDVTVTATLPMTTPPEVGGEVTGEAAAGAAPAPTAMPASVPTEPPAVAASPALAAAPAPAAASEETSTESSGVSVASAAAPTMPAPTVVAESRQAARTLARSEVQDTNALSQPLVFWVRFAELVLGMAFIVLATVTIVVMIRRRQAG
jgi:hypothetical protein